MRPHAADKLRPDLRALGTLGDGYHGFEYIFAQPLSSLKSYEIRVQFADTNELVPAGRATLHAEPVLFADPLSPILVSAIDPGDAGIMVRALGEHQQIITADLPGSNLQLLSYYARAAEVMNSPGDTALGLSPLFGATEHLTIGRNPFHHPSFQQIFPRKRMLHEFLARSAGRTIGTAFRSVVLDLYQELARQQNKHEARRFAERSDLFDVSADFAHTAFRQTTNIVVTRDLRDLYCAARDRWFTSHTEIVEHLRSAADRMRWLGRAHPDETIFIKFEDLLAAPAQVLAEVWNVLGLDPRTGAPTKTGSDCRRRATPRTLSDGRRSSIVRSVPRSSRNSATTCAGLAMRQTSMTPQVHASPIRQPRSVCRVSQAVPLMSERGICREF